jgi:hypothetical protein
MDFVHVAVVGQTLTVVPDHVFRETQGHQLPVGTCVNIAQGSVGGIGRVRPKYFV